MIWELSTYEMTLTKTVIKSLIYEVTGAAIEVHRSIGPGLLESVYQRCLAKELELRGIAFKQEVSVPVIYKGLEIDTVLRCDFFVENCLVVELKAVETIHPVHEAQILTYLKLLEVPKGILINFNVVNIVKEGQRAYVTETYRDLPV